MLRQEDAPFAGDYTGRDEIGKPTCAHVFRRFQGNRINPFICARLSANGAYCSFHNTKAKRNIDN